MYYSYRIIIIIWNIEKILTKSVFTWQSGTWPATDYPGCGTRRQVHTTNQKPGCPLSINAHRTARDMSQIGLALPITSIFLQPKCRHPVRACRQHLGYISSTAVSKATFRLPPFRRAFISVSLFNTLHLRIILLFPIFKRKVTKKSPCKTWNLSGNVLLFFWRRLFGTHYQPISEICHHYV